MFWLIFCICCVVLLITCLIQLVSELSIMLNEEKEQKAPDTPITFEGVPTWEAKAIVKRLLKEDRYGPHRLTKFTC